jgi:hypothetical protein
MNISLQEGFKQVCVWPACVVGKGKEDEFIKFMLEEFKARVQYLEEIKTTPDTNRGRLVEGTGGRNDLFFAVHNEDLGKFTIPRLSVGIRWIDDVLAKCNYNSRIYPERVFDYCSWNKESLEYKNTEEE